MKLILTLVLSTTLTTNIFSNDLSQDENIPEDLKREISSISKDGKNLTGSNQQELIEQLKEFKKRKDEENKILEEIMDE